MSHLVNDIREEQIKPKPCGLEQPARRNILKQSSRTAYLDFISDIVVYLWCLSSRQASRWLFSVSPKAWRDELKWTRLHLVHHLSHCLITRKIPRMQGFNPMLEKRKKSMCVPIMTLSRLYDCLLPLVSLELLCHFLSSSQNYKVCSIT